MALHVLRSLGLGLALEVALPFDSSGGRHGVEFTGLDSLGQGVDDGGQGFQLLDRNGGHALRQLKRLSPIAKREEQAAVGVGEPAATNVARGFDSRAIARLVLAGDDARGFEGLAGQVSADQGLLFGEITDELLAVAGRGVRRGGLRSDQLQRLEHRHRELPCGVVVSRL